MHPFCCMHTTSNHTISNLCIFVPCIVSHQFNGSGQLQAPISEIYLFLEISLSMHVSVSVCFFCLFHSLFQFVFSGLLQHARIHTPSIYTISPVCVCKYVWVCVQFSKRQWSTIRHRNSTIIAYTDASYCNFQTFSQ